MGDNEKESSTHQNGISLISPPLYSVSFHFLDLSSRTFFLPKCDPVSEPDGPRHRLHPGPHSPRFGYGRNQCVSFSDKKVKWSKFTQIWIDYLYCAFLIDDDPLSLLGSIGYLGRYLVGHKNLKNCRALKFLLSTENITRSLLPTFHCPEQIKDKVLELSDLSLQITIQNVNSYLFLLFFLKLMHNCHFVQLALFVLKKFLFSSRQQKS